MAEELVLITPVVSYKPGKTYVVPILNLPERITEFHVDAALDAARKKNRIPGKHFFVVLRGEVWFVVKINKTTWRFYFIEREYHATTDDNRDVDPVS